MVTQINLTRNEGWSAYRHPVGPLTQRFGGRYLAAGGVTVGVPEGLRDGRSLVVHGFPSIDAIHSIWNSLKYADV